MQPGNLGLGGSIKANEHGSGYKQADRTEVTADICMPKDLCYAGEVVDVADVLHFIIY